MKEEKKMGEVVKLEINAVQPIRPDQIAAVESDLVDCLGNNLHWSVNRLPSGRYGNKYSLPSRERLHQMAPTLERGVVPATRKQVLAAIVMIFSSFPRGNDVQTEEQASVVTELLAELLSPYPPDIIKAAITDLAGNRTKRWLMPLCDYTEACKRLLARRRYMLRLIPEMLREHDGRDRDEAREMAREERCDAWYQSMEGPTEVMDIYKIDGRHRLALSYQFFFIAERLGKAFLDEMHNAITRGQIWTVFPIHALPDKITSMDGGLQPYEREWALRFIAEVKARFPETDQPATKREIQAALDTHYTAIVRAADNNELRRSSLIASSRRTTIL